jgi:hypothetical protein
MERKEWIKLASLAALFLAVYLLPIGSEPVERAVGEGLRLTQWYAREHVILCLLPAFLIAGAIAAFVDKAAILKYLGPKANKPAAYGVGATSGCVLAVCSCTVLPLFAGIYRMGAGLGPAMAFLYAGPAINVLAVILTARVLGVEIGLARAIGAVVFSVFVGLIMAALFERPKQGDEPEPAFIAPDAGEARPLHQLAALFGLMVAVLIFANWSGAPDATGVWHLVYTNEWIEQAVGGNGLGANLGASVVGAFMYFATLTEIPILEGLLGSGMGKGPALALLLAGPALSLPNMLVIRSVIGTKKTAAYVTIVIVGSTLAGLLYGSLF